MRLHHNQAACNPATANQSSNGPSGYYSSKDTDLTNECSGGDCKRQKARESTREKRKSKAEAEDRERKNIHHTEKFVVVSLDCKRPFISRLFAHTEYFP